MSSPEIKINLKKFRHDLLYKYRGGWFEEGDRHFRIGYNWEKVEKLEKSLKNIFEYD